MARARYIVRAVEMGTNDTSGTLDIRYAFGERRLA
jgi:hypothetical protein